MEDQTPEEDTTPEAPPPPRSILEVPDLPECLKLTAEQRAASWEGHRYTDARSGLDEDEVAVRQRAREAALAEEKARKSAESLAKLKGKHAGERYDKKAKAWVPVATAAVTPPPPERPASPLGKWLED